MPSFLLVEQWTATLHQFIVSTSFRLSFSQAACLSICMFVGSSLFMLVRLSIKLFVSMFCNLSEYQSKDF